MVSDEFASNNVGIAFIVPVVSGVVSLFPKFTLTDVELFLLITTKLSLLLKKLSVAPYNLMFEPNLNEEVVVNPTVPTPLIGS